MHTAEDILINVPEIEPRMKHPTIFQVFDGLQAGESLVIHNDHDPKPVYYQLLGERGDVFHWQYLEQGPETWKVRVTKRAGESTETVGQIAAKDLRKVEVFKKYGIDFCCGGKKTVRQICQEKGLDATKVEQELQLANQQAGATKLEYNEWNLDFLADFIVNTHHSYVRKTLPELRGYAIKVARVHGSKHPELLHILSGVEAIAEALSRHMEEEEKVLFPYIKRIVALNTFQLPMQDADNSLSTIIRDMEQEHDYVGRALEDIRAWSNNFAIPEDACASYKVLYNMIGEFEGDLFTHIHLENNILFPKAIDMEKSLPAPALVDAGSCALPAR